MKTDLIRIGNSRGVRIPKPLIEQCGFGETVEMSVKNDSLIISPTRESRRGWNDAFRAAGNPAEDEVMLEVKGLNEFDRKEWQW